MLKCVKMITLSNKESEKTEENNKSSIAQTDRTDNTANKNSNESYNNKSAKVSKENRNKKHTINKNSTDRSSTMSTIRSAIRWIHVFVKITSTSSMRSTNKARRKEVDKVCHHRETETVRNFSPHSPEKEVYRYYDILFLQHLVSLKKWDDLILAGCRVLYYLIMFGFQGILRGASKLITRASLPKFSTMQPQHLSWSYKYPTPQHLDKSQVP